MKLWTLTVALAVVGSCWGRDVAVKIRCVRVTHCPELMRLLMVRPVTPEVIQTIRTANCGFDGLIEMVWCPIFEEIEDAAQPSGNLEDRHSDFRADEDLFPKDCGEINSNKVLGGSPTELDDYPWMVMLQYSHRKNPKTLVNGCGGALINSRYVLTAAHCVTLGSVPVRVVLGEYDTRNDTDCSQIRNVSYCAPPAIYRSIEKIVTHPQWLVKGISPFYHDIALLRLSEPVDYTDFVQPICLPPSNMSRDNFGTYIVAGWGKTEEGQNSDVKLHVGVPYVDNSRCTQVLRRNIGDGQMCAGGLEGKDGCRGDSGGPLMAVDFTEGRTMAVGISSLDLKGCGVAGYPAIYTYVPEYIDWIRDTVRSY